MCDGVYGNEGSGDGGCDSVIYIIALIYVVVWQCIW